MQNVRDAPHGIVYNCAIRDASLDDLQAGFGL
jgi:hypothetical protein